MASRSFTRFSPMTVLLAPVSMMPVPFSPKFLPLSHSGIGDLTTLKLVSKAFLKTWRNLTVENLLTPVDLKCLTSCNPWEVTKMNSSLTGRYTGGIIPNGRALSELACHMVSSAFSGRFMTSSEPEMTLSSTSRLESAAGVVAIT